MAQMKCPGCPNKLKKSPKGASLVECVRNHLFELKLRDGTMDQYLVCVRSPDDGVAVGSEHPVPPGTTF